MHNISATKMDYKGVKATTVTVIQSKNIENAKVEKQKKLVKKNNIRVIHNKRYNDSSTPVPEKPRKNSTASSKNYTRPISPLYPTLKLTEEKPEKREIDCIDWELMKEEFDACLSSNAINNTDLELDEFDYVRLLGKGHSGSVVLAERRDTKLFYALKVMKKAKIVKEKMIQSVLNEKKILQAMDYPFIIGYFSAFKDNANLYHCFEALLGGELFDVLQRLPSSSKKAERREEIVKFYAAQVLLGFEYLHYLNVLYRDLKPENIVVDTSGYIKLADFGFAKVVESRTYTFCGTPEYIAPEIILNKGYGKAADYWAYGVFIYEMCKGSSPFYNENDMEPYKKIVEGKFSIPENFSKSLAHLVSNLLQIDLTRRYGNLKRGIEDIKQHNWFQTVDWESIYAKTLKAPYVPNLSGKFEYTDDEEYEEMMECFDESEWVLYEKEFLDF